MQDDLNHPYDFATGFKNTMENSRTWEIAHNMERSRLLRVSRYTWKSMKDMLKFHRFGEGVRSQARTKMNVQQTFSTQLPRIRNMSCGTFLNIT